jgi:hypothetical protein
VVVRGILDGVDGRGGSGSGRDEGHGGDARSVTFLTDVGVSEPGSARERAGARDELLEDVPLRERMQVSGRAMRRGRRKTHLAAGFAQSFDAGRRSTVGVSRDAFPTVDR